MSRISGTLTADILNVLTTANLPNSSVSDAQVNSGSPLGVTKARHLPLAATAFDLAIGGTVVASERVIHVADGDETVREFRCGLNGAITNGGTASFDLKKNGTTILSGTVDFTSADAAREVKTSTPTSATLVAGDWLSVAITVASSPDGTGPFAVAELDVRAI